jgi:rhodanese-related sulfurtransferase
MVDVRSASDHGNYSIRGSRNIPLDFLRKARRAFDPRKLHITCSDQEIESAVAAFVLAQQGLEACYLSGTVGEYLQSTGEFSDDSGGMSLGEHGEGIIELPDDFPEADSDGGSHVTFDDHDIEPTTSPPPAGNSAAGDLAALRAEFRLALENQQLQHEQDLTTLRNEMLKVIESSSKFVIQRLMDKLAALEMKMGPGGKS